MTDQREMFETQKANCEEKLRGLKAYVSELTGTCAKHGTDEAVVHEDLAKAKCDIEFYEGQIEALGEALAKETGTAAFHVYKDEAGEWRWRLKAANGRVIADSGEGYRDRGGCIHSIELVRSFNKAPVKEGH